MIHDPTALWQQPFFGILHIGFWFGIGQCIHTLVGIDQGMRLALSQWRLKRRSYSHSKFNNQYQHSGHFVCPILPLRHIAG